MGFQMHGHGHAAFFQVDTESRLAADSPAPLPAATGPAGAPEIFNICNLVLYNKVSNTQALKHEQYCEKWGNNRNFRVILLFTVFHSIYKLDKYFAVFHIE